MFELSINLSQLDTFTSRVAGFDVRLRKALVAAIRRSTLAVETRAKALVSGPVLMWRSGTLRRSIHCRTEEIPGGVRGVIGASARYARIHELGGTIHHPGGTAYIVVNHWAVFVANKDVAAFGNLPRTRAHNIPMPERSYLRRSLREKTALIRAEIQAAVREGAAFGGGSVEI